MKGDHLRAVGDGDKPRGLPEHRLFKAPTPIEPHPEFGALPPCDAGIGGHQPCPRDATTHYGYGVYCDEHMEVTRLGREVDEASMAVFHAKRMLWQAHELGFERLEDALASAVGDYDDDLRSLQRQMERARRKAGD